MKSVLNYTGCRETNLTASDKSVPRRKDSVEVHHLRYGYDEGFSFYVFRKNVKTPLMVLPAMSKLSVNKCHNYGSDFDKTLC